MTTTDPSGRQKLAASPSVDRWDDWIEVDPRALPEIVEHHYTLVPSSGSAEQSGRYATCFECALT